MPSKPDVFQTLEAFSESSFSANLSLLFNFSAKCMVFPPMEHPLQLHYDTLEREYNISISQVICPELHSAKYAFIWMYT